ncbi:DUF3836 domain-containing protein [Dysgonomonas sp. HGC4]|uniref:DUF3836 domain-containing protein n=1 Tax=Dysgonomonas sp. HGC4 TaxID=1658009 RepID=UPI0006829CC4|nr:DUF3836 domain-containing protein [Dysgonomonas sp. HGC4]MBD8347366.1 DUF3836 domain-containing protein [Dysgonomonas sp. HGC4]
MKANVFTSVVVALLLFATNSSVVKADSDAVLYHNVEKTENVVSTTYFKGDVKNNNLVPFKKKVNTLNEQGAFVSKITYIWNESNKNWTPSNMMVYTYDGTKVMSVSHYAWNENSKTWGEPKKASYTYNENGTSVQ